MNIDPYNPIIQNGVAIFIKSFLNEIAKRLALLKPKKQNAPEEKRKMAETLLELGTKDRDCITKDDISLLRKYYHRFPENSREAQALYSAWSAFYIQVHGLWSIKDKKPVDKFEHLPILIVAQNNLTRLAKAILGELDITTTFEPTVNGDYIVMSDKIKKMLKLMREAEQQKRATQKSLRQIEKMYGSYKKTGSLLQFPN